MKRMSVSCRKLQKKGKLDVSWLMVCLLEDDRQKKNLWLPDLVEIFIIIPFKITRHDLSELNNYSTVKLKTVTSVFECI